MTREAFDLSERLGLPVMIRLVTRLSHSRSPVVTQTARPQNPLRLGDSKDWTLLPVNARRRFSYLVDRQADMAQIADGSPFNVLALNPDNSELGVIASGVAWNYVREALRDVPRMPSLLKIGTFPPPEKLMRELFASVGTVLVAEDGYPLIEESLTGLFGIPEKTVKGKLSGDLPATGELSPDILRQALGLPPPAAHPAPSIPLASRPPQLCAGCPHADTFKALNRALEGVSPAGVFSDIGCYTLGALPPYNAIHTCVCMGASIGMAKGAAEAGLHPAVAVIGDSTFAHSGITPLITAAAANTRMTVFILDNGTTAMTGGQPSFGTGDRLLRIIAGAGVPPEHIRTITPLPKHLDANTAAIREEIEYDGLSVVVAVRECVVEARKRS